jgi:hypothetical protein
MWSVASCEGIDAALTARCLDALYRLGIEKTHIDILAENALAHDYLTHSGWKRQTDIIRYPFNSSSDPNI